MRLRKRKGMISQQLLKLVARARKLAAQPIPTDPQDYNPPPLAPNLASATIKADDIPVAKTPKERYTTFPKAVLAGCNEPLPKGVPDLRGVWYTYKGPFKEHVERIEQCGNRVVVTGGLIIHDMRADGTLENGVNDINENTGEEIHIGALFENGRLNLRANNKILGVSRRLEGDEIVWMYLSKENRMRRLKAPPNLSE